MQNSRDAYDEMKAFETKQKVRFISHEAGINYIWVTSQYFEVLARILGEGIRNYDLKKVRNSSDLAVEEIAKKYNVNIQMFTMKIV